MPYSSTHLVELAVACYSSKPHTSSSVAVDKKFQKGNL